MRLFNTSVFASHELFPAGAQALAILAGFKCRVDLLKGENAIAHPGAVVLFPCTGENFPNKYLRILPKNPAKSEDIARHERARELMWTVNADTLVGINMRRAFGTTFAGRELEGFTEALRGLCGYVHLDPAAQKLRREARHARYMENRRERVYS